MTILDNRQFSKPATDLRSGRFLRPHHRLSARVGYRPLQPALQLLHGRGDGVPSQARPADHRGTGPALHRLCRAGRQASAADRRRAFDAARDHGSGEWPCAASAQRRAGGIDPYPPMACACGNLQLALPLPASSGSMCRSTVLTAPPSPASPAQTNWARCWTVLPLREGRRALKVKINTVALKDGQRPGNSRTDPLGPCRRSGHHPDRNHADG